MIRKISYTGNSKVIQRLCEAVNSLIDSGGTSVSVTPIQQTGTNIADITVNGSVKHIYSPNGGALIYGNDGHLYVDYDLIEGE